ncbi:hypothetical protein KAR91_75185 [Candidatus Pacearchaeota archaeon]|nr:hypothetical protein [Candidatus Pacearchaeota archaeon]
MIGMFDSLMFGQRLFAHGKWWIQLNPYRNGFYLVVDPDRLEPPVLPVLVQQSKEAALYQSILFRTFEL